MNSNMSEVTHKKLGAKRGSMVNNLTNTLETTHSEVMERPMFLQEPTQPGPLFKDKSRTINHERQMSVWDSMILEQDRKHREEESRKQNEKRSKLEELKAYNLQVMQ